MLLKKEGGQNKSFLCNFWFPSVSYLCEGIKKKRIWRRKKFFLPPSRRLMSREPWSHRQCQRNCTANHTKDSSSLSAPFQVVFKKTRAFLDVLSDLHPANTSHKVLRRKQIWLDPETLERDRVRGLRLLSSRSLWRSEDGMGQNVRFNGGGDMFIHFCECSKNWPTWQF